MRLVAFDDLIFSGFDQRDRLDLPESPGALSKLPGGGAYDAYGAERAPAGSYQLPVHCELHAATAAGLQTQLDAWRAKRGLRGRLRLILNDGSTRWCWARCTRVQYERGREHFAFQPLDLLFEIPQPGWWGTRHGGPWWLDLGVALDLGYHLDADAPLPLVGGPQTLSITNAGNQRITNAVITVRAGSAAITAVTIAVPYVSSFTWSGTLLAGHDLVLNCGALSVINWTSDAYSGFALDAGHVIDDWLRLEPGANSVDVTLTGGGTGSTMLFEFYDSWE